MQTIKDLAAGGMGLLVVEQNLGVATSLAERQLVMVTGSIATETTAAELVDDPAAPAPLPRRRAAARRGLMDPRFTFGLWTVGTPAATRSAVPRGEPLDPADSVRKLAELGAWGVSLHDDDLVPWGTPRPSATGSWRASRRPSRRPASAWGWPRPTCSAPGLQGRRVHLERPRRPARAIAEGDALDRPRRRAGRGGVRLLGRPRGDRGAARQGPARRARAVPGGDRRARRLRGRAGLRAALRDRAEAERAARGHVPADHRARPRTSSAR